MIEGFSNPNWMMQADRVLKEIGKEKAQEYYKVGINFFFFFLSQLHSWSVCDAKFICCVYIFLVIMDG